MYVGTKQCVEAIVVVKFHIKLLNYQKSNEKEMNIKKLLFMNL